MTLPQPTLRRVPTGGQRVLVEDYPLGDPRHGVWLLTVPAGFVHDGASVPRAARSLLDDDDLGDAAPLVHDWLYHRGGRLAEGTWTRAHADRLFRDLLAADGVPRWRREAAYAAVRLFGARAWRTPTAGARVQRVLGSPPREVA